MTRGESGVIGWREGKPEEANALLPPAAKRVEFINFSKPKQSHGWRDSADCSVGRREVLKALSKSHRSLPQGSPAAVSDIHDNPEKKNVFFGL